MAKASKISTKILIEESYGKLPTLKGLEVGTSEYRLANARMLNWVNVMFETSELKKIFVKREGVKFSDVPDYEFKTLGALSHFLDNGEELSVDAMEWYDRKVSEIVEKYNLNEVAEVASTPVVNTNLLTYYNARNYLADMVEDRTVRREDDNTAYNYLVELKGNKFVFKKLKDYVDEVIAELVDARSEETAEYFENVSDEALNADLEQYKMLKEMLFSIEENTKATRRKPRKRVKSAEKMTKNVKFMQNDDSLNITSINPGTIVGAQALMVFNVKTRKLGMYYAKDESGLAMKGTTVQNFSEKSTAKTVRKPNDVLPHFRKGTRIRRWETLFSDINAKSQSLTGRINADTLIVKVLSV